MELSENKRDTYYYLRKELGICVRCGDERTEFGKSTCWKCRLEARKRSSEYYKKMTYEQKQSNYEKQKERHIRQKQERTEKGLCVQCGKRPPKDGSKRCKYCLSSQKRQRMRKNEENGKIPREQWADMGLCVRCGKPNNTEHKICASCYANNNFVNSKQNIDRSRHIWKREKSVDYEAWAIHNPEKAQKVLEERQKRLEKLGIQPERNNT